MLLVLAIAALDCAPAAAAAGRTNLLLITVDTLRADFLGCYGFNGDNTPNVDRLASQGVLFEDTISVIGKTGPAFASLFSSLYPPTHGARRNGVRMREDVPVLAEKLREAGYTTGAFISNWTLKSHLSGTHRGFDLYDDQNFDRERNSFGAVERDAADVTRAAVTWLESTPADRPVFLWIHYSEPHSPYDLRGATAPKAAEKGDGDGPRSRRYKYSSEVGYADTWIGNLLARAEKRLPAGLDPHGVPERPRREPRRARLLGPRQEHPLAEPAHPAGPARARHPVSTTRHRGSVDRRRPPHHPRSARAGRSRRRRRTQPGPELGAARIPTIVCASRWASAPPRSPGRVASTTTIRW